MQTREPAINAEDVKSQNAWSGPSRGIEPPTFRGFFEREQVSLHTILVYSEWPPDWDELSYPDLMQRAKQMMQTIVYFSDDKHHDATYVTRRSLKERIFYQSIETGA